jgi:hypothetical protein
MNDPESAYRVISTELSRRRAPELQRASLAWDARRDDPPVTEDCCVSGDYDDAA